jgi:integrase/recombinase XerD
MIIDLRGAESGTVAAWVCERRSSRQCLRRRGKVRPIVHLRAAYTKAAGRATSLFSSPALRRVLEKYGERDWLGSATASQAALFASQKGGAMTPGSMARFLEAHFAEAGIPGASSHSGRRTLITRLAERGIDLKAIAEIAGHTSIRTTTMYVETNPKRLARILGRTRSFGR